MSNTQPFEHSSATAVASTMATSRFSTSPANSICIDVSAIHIDTAKASDNNNNNDTSVADKPMSQQPKQAKKVPLNSYSKYTYFGKLGDKRVAIKMISLLQLNNNNYSITASPLFELNNQQQQLLFKQQEEEGTEEVEPQTPSDSILQHTLEEQLENARYATAVLKIKITFIM